MELVSSCLSTFKFNFVNCSILDDRVIFLKILFMIYVRSNYRQFNFVSYSKNGKEGNLKETRNKKE